MLKNRYLLIAAFAAVLLLGGLFRTEALTSGTEPTSTWTLTQYEYGQYSPSLSNNNTYINGTGNTVQSPAYSTNGSVPPGATAECADGTYSFSQSARGTCSSHGGVYQWLS